MCVRGQVGDRWLSYANLFAVDLGHADLRGADLRGADLSGANLSCAKLEGATLEGAVLAAAKLQHATGLSCAQLGAAREWAASYRDVALACGRAIPTILDGCGPAPGAVEHAGGAEDLGALLRSGVDRWNTWREAHPERPVDLSGAALGPNLRGANLRGANLHDAQIFAGDLREADLRGADLRSDRLIWLDLRGSRIDAATQMPTKLRLAWEILHREQIGRKLRGADLSFVILKGAELAEADLRGAKLENTSFRDTRLGRAKLSGAVLVDANLQGANLTGVALERANLAGADLSSATLRDARAERADFRGADLRGLDLRGTALTGADLTGAGLGGADLRGVRGLTCPALQSAIGWSGAFRSPGLACGAPVPLERPDGGNSRLQ